MTTHADARPEASSDPRPHQFADNTPGGIAQTLLLFHSPGDTVELRILAAGRKSNVDAGYFRDLEKAEAAVMQHDMRAPAGIYFVLNAVNPDLYSRSPDTTNSHTIPTTADRDIIRRRWILFDADPDRPSGISSSDAEMQAAESVAASVRDWLTERFGWTEPIEAMSGNGWHLLFPVDLPNDESSKKLVEQILKAASVEAERMQIADGPRVKIDTAVGNAARITKLYGSVARKGHDTPERPHRLSRIVHVPDNLRPENAAKNRPAISLDKLQAVAALSPQPATKSNGHTNGKHHSGFDSRLDLGRYLQARGIRVREVSESDGWTKHILECCIFDPSHTGKDAMFTQHVDGGLAYKCFHDSCSGIKWQEAKQHIGPPDNDHYDPPLKPKPNPQSKPQPSLGNNFANTTLESGQWVMALDKGNFGTVVEDHGDTATIHFVSPDGQEADVELSKSELADPDGRALVATGEPILPASLATLIERHPRLRKPVVHGLVREGETANIIAASKVGKSWLSYGLALSIIAGRDWLDRFECEAGRVLLIDNELHPETIRHRIPTVADAMGIPTDIYRESYDVVSLRGRLVDYAQLGPRVIDHIEAGHYRAIIVDAHYRMLPPGVNENENAAMAGLYNMIDQYAEQTQAAWFLIHHASKGNQSDKAVTDVGSGAGSQSRAADSHLVLRPHEEQGCITLEAAVRSWPPVDPVVLEWSYPIWNLSNLDPAKLKGRTTANEQRQEDRDREGVKVMVEILRKWNPEKDGPATPNAITEVSPFGRDKTRKLIGKMFYDGQLQRNSIRIRNNDTFEYFFPDDDTGI